MSSDFIEDFPETDTFLPHLDVISFWPSEFTWFILWLS
jgi:hypothetical protein